MEDRSELTGYAIFKDGKPFLHRIYNRLRDANRLISYYSRRGHPDLEARIAKNIEWVNKW